MEIIAQKICKDSEAEVLLMDVRSGMKILNFPKVCFKYKDATHDEMFLNYLSKLKILTIVTRNQFEIFISNLEGLILLLPKLTLLVIDTLAFYHEFSYSVTMSKQRFNRKTYFKLLVKKFKMLAELHEITIVFTTLDMFSETSNNTEDNLFLEDAVINKRSQSYEVDDNNYSSGNFGFENHSRRSPNDSDNTMWTDHDDNDDDVGDCNPNITMFTTRTGFNDFSIKVINFDNDIYNEVKFTVNENGANFIE
jgi:hypothetical protein